MSKKIITNKAKQKRVEIEIQVKVEGLNLLLQFLEKNGQFIGEKHQVDKYFTPKHRDFTSEKPVKEWLRLRNSSGKFSINYKNWHHEKDGRSHYCDEYESEVENLDQLELILTALNAQPIVEVNKVRKIWNYKDYEIAIDSVNNLGDFVEIEYKGTGRKKPAEITKEMVSFLKKLGCGKIVRNYNGYPYGLPFPDEIVEEEL